jgi:hypothetical protein
METDFSVELARVKAKILSRGAVGLAGLGRVTAQVTGLRHFPYPGAVELAGLGRVMAQVTGLARVKLV